MTTKTTIPLVRLSLLLPFLQELDRRDVNADAVLAQSGLVRETVLDESVFVPPIVVHRFLEQAAQSANDPYLAVNVGERLDWASWPPMIEAASKARNLAGFLVRFIRAASSEASSASHELNIGAKFSVFREKRLTEQEIAPSQNDAFTAAYTLSLLRRAAAARWQSDDVRLTVCDTSALPKRYQGVHIMGGDRRGVMVRFPTAWLLEPFNRETFLQPNVNDSSNIPTRFMDVLKHLIAPQLHERELSVARVAEWVGASPQSLQRQLRASGTTLTHVIATLKQDRAITALSNTERSIGDIASSLGYDNPTSFTRAFKSWTGLSPRAYRKKNRKA